MPHQCTKCGKIYPDAFQELLTGCSCGSRFFYYIKQEKFELLKSEMKKVMVELEKADKEQIEKDIRELTGITDPDKPVILDLETIRVIKPGKFEIDIVNLFSRNRPLIYKLGEGKYIIDIASSLGKHVKPSTEILDEIEKIEESEKEEIDGKYEKSEEKIEIEEPNEYKK